MANSKQESPHFLSRQIPAICFLILLAILASTTPQTINAQDDGQPTTIIDAAFQDLSQRLGHTVNRSSNKFTWSQEEFSNSSMGCPAPGQNYAQSIRKGYKILIIDNNITYDYRATLDGKVLFLCTPQRPANAGEKLPTLAATAAATAESIFVTPLSPQEAALPITYNNPIAYVGANGNVYVTGAGKGAGTQITKDVTVKSDTFAPLPNKIYSDLRWSPNGAKLLFHDADGMLYIYPSGGDGKVIPAKLASGNPVTWSPDGSQVAYPVQTNQPGKTSNSIQMQIQTLAGSGDEPKVIGTFDQQVGCGGSDPDPATQLYSIDAGFGGNHLVFEWLSDGFLYSTSCSGNGVALLDPQTGGNKWQLDGVGRIAVAENRSTAVGIQLGTGNPNGKIVVIDLATGKTTPLGDAPNVDQVAISPDGNVVYYSILNAKPLIKADPAKSKIGQDLLGTWPLDGASNQVTLWRIPITGGEGFSLFTQEGRGISQLGISADATNVAFTFVTSTAAAVDAINKGGTTNTVLAVRPTATVYLLTLTGRQPSKLAEGRLVQISTGTAFIAKPAISKVANVTCPGFMPSRLVIGQQGRVTLGEPNRLRSEEGGGTILATIPGGGIFTVLEGPLCTANGTAWWKVNYNNQIGWTPEGQGNVYFTEPVGLN